MRKYSPDDPRYHDRFEAAIELVRMWRGLMQEDADGVYRQAVANDPTVNTLVKWTDEFLDHPLTPTQ